MIKTMVWVSVASSLGGSSIALGAPVGPALVPGNGHAVVLAQAQTPSKPKAKQRRRTARQPAPSSGGSASPPAGATGFDPKKIWESD